MRKTVLIISAIGLLVSLYAVQLHYGSGESFCNIGDTFNCDKVNKSTYSELLGIPVSILGSLSYLLVFILVLKMETISKKLDFTHRDYLQYLFLFTIAMLAFQVYLTGVEVFILNAYCIVCLISQLCTFMLALVIGKELYS